MSSSLKRLNSPSTTTAGSSIRFRNLVIFLILLFVIVYQAVTISNLQRSSIFKEAHQCECPPTTCDKVLQCPPPPPVLPSTTSNLLLPTSTAAGTLQKSKRYAGVAVTVFLGSPRWFQNRYTMMINLLLGSLPEGWVVQIFYASDRGMAVEGGKPTMKLPLIIFHNTLSYVF